jgi:hypothetical protein
VNSAATDMRSTTATVGTAARSWSGHAFGTRHVEFASTPLPSAYLAVDVKGIRHRPSEAST